MKNKIKNIIVGIISLAMVLMASSAFASSAWSSIWNNASNDCPSIAIANYTTNTGYTDPCWPLSTVSANPGDSINVRVYYHNTSNQNATNVRVLLTQSTGNSNSHSFSGQIISDQGSISFGPVNVNTSNSGGISYGSTRWYPNQKQTQVNFIDNQDGSEILNGGLRIGTITPGWSSQGSVVVSFHIKEKPKPTGSISANPNSCIISAGNSKCLIPFSWNTTNPVDTSVVLNGNGSVVATSNNGNESFYTSFGSSTFKLRNNGIDLDTATVSASCAAGSDWDYFNSFCKEEVNDCVITSFTASDTNVDSNSPVTLSWNTSYCNSVNISGVGTGLSANGNVTVYPTDTTTYTLTAFGDTNVTPTKSLEVVAGGPAYAPGFPAGAPGYKSN